MERVLASGRRAKAFAVGTYGGAPIDYLLAIAMVYTLMVVLVAHDLMRTL